MSCCVFFNCFEESYKLSQPPHGHTTPSPSFPRASGGHDFTRPWVLQLGTSPLPSLAVSPRCPRQHRGSDDQRPFRLELLRWDWGTPRSRVTAQKVLVLVGFIIPKPEGKYILKTIYDMDIVHKSTHTHTQTHVGGGGAQKEKKHIMNVYMSGMYVHLHAWNQPLSSKRFIMASRSRSRSPSALL